MEKVVKRTFGYGKPKENENYTHVILTEDEHNNKNLKIRDLENDVKAWEKKYNEGLEHYKNSANDTIKKLQTEADGRVAEAQAETEKQKKEADKFKNLNENLIRVATERANVKRGITPKKEHSGYIILNAEEFTFNCECDHATKSNRTVVIKLPCFRIRLQSPYDTSFDLKSAKDLIYDDFLNKIMNKMGIESVYKGGLSGYDENAVRKIWSDKESFMFRLIYKANYQKGFWEVEFLSRDMPVVSPDMTAKK